MILCSLFSSFDNIVVFDIETTGLDPRNDEIIEIALLRVVNIQEHPVIEDEFNLLIKLTAGMSLPSIVTNLTGITEIELHDYGVDKRTACERIVDTLCFRNTVIVAYNAQFDLSFLFHFLNSFGKAEILKKSKMLDALTIYKDRKPYPHKLIDAAKMYSLKTPGSHRAYDDASITLELLYAMWKEYDDLLNYVNLFGYNPKYGVNGQRISSVRYVAQGYENTKKLYKM